MSEYTTLIVPTPEAEQAVESWRTRFDPWARCGIPAHITLLGPFLPRSRLDDCVREQLASLLGEHRQTEIELNRVEQLPGAVSLLPNDDGTLRQITRDLLVEWPELRARSRTERERPYHVTIACTEEPDRFDEIRFEMSRFLPIRTCLREVLLLVALRNGKVVEFAGFKFRDPQA